MKFEFYASHTGRTYHQYPNTWLMPKRVKITTPVPTMQQLFGGRVSGISEGRATDFGGFRRGESATIYARSAGKTDTLSVRSALYYRLEARRKEALASGNYILAELMKRQLYELVYGLGTLKDLP